MKSSYSQREPSTTGLWTRTLVVASPALYNWAILLSLPLVQFHYCRYMNVLQDDTAVQVVDGVLDDIRIGMEINHPKYNQRRLAIVKYIGELYNYRLVDSTVIFKTLYSFITFGVTYDENIPTPLGNVSLQFRSIHRSFKFIVLPDQCFKLWIAFSNAFTVSFMHVFLDIGKLV